MDDKDALHTGDFITEECLPLGNLPIGIPYRVDPLVLHSFEYLTKLPKASDRDALIAKIKALHPDPSNNGVKLIICNEETFGRKGTLLRLVLKKVHTYGIEEDCYLISYAEGGWGWQPGHCDQYINGYQQSEVIKVQFQGSAQGLIPIDKDFNIGGRANVQVSFKNGKIDWSIQNNEFNFNTHGTLGQGGLPLIWSTPAVTLQPGVIFSPECIAYARSASFNIVSIVCPDPPISSS